MEPIFSKLSGRHCNQGELPPSYILGGSDSHPPGSKRGHSYLTYLWNQLKVIDMLNDHARGKLQSCCYPKQFWMTLLHVSLPPAQACGGEGILYIFFSYFLDTLSSRPHYKSLSGALLLAAPCFTFTLVKYYVIYVIKYFTTFFASNFFSLFSSSKT